MLELMMTVFVAAIIIGIGIPNLIQFVQNNRMTAAANDLLASMHIARAEAVKRQSIMTVCASNNPTAANPTCGVGNFNGWIVFNDINGNIVVDAPGEVVIQAHDALAAQLNISANANYTSYATSGFMRAGPIGPPATLVLLCDARGNAPASGARSTARVVRIDPTGRSQVLRTQADVTAANGALGAGCN